MKRDIYISKYKKIFRTCLLALLTFLILAISVQAADYSFVRKWGSSGPGNGQFSKPFRVSVDSDGNVYVADSNNNRIQKFDSAGTYVTQWGSSGSGNGQFANPFCVSVDSHGNVFIAERNNHRIQEFAPILYAITVSTDPTGLTTPSGGGT